MKKIIIRTLTRRENGNTIVERVNTNTRKIVEKYTLNSKKEREGLYQRFSENGVLIEEVVYKKNKKEGLFIKNNKEGNPILRVEYKKGLKHGVYKSYWHSNNNLCEESIWKNAILEGSYKIYDEDSGELRYHREYKNNRLVKDFLK